MGDKVELWTQFMYHHVQHHFSAQWGETTNTLWPVPFRRLGQSPSPLHKCPPGERKKICPWRPRLISFLSLCLVSILMGLDCTSVLLMVSWDRSYRWNHSNLTFGNTGQFPLLWTPSLTSNIAWSMWAVSQSLKGFLLYRHLCCKGICCDGIWAV